MNQRGTDLTVCILSQLSWFNLLGIAECFIGPIYTEDGSSVLDELAY